MVQYKGTKYKIERQAETLKTKQQCAKLSPRTTVLQGG